MKRPYTPSIISLIKKGGIGVIPTDTIYGMIGSALIPETVARIYKIRNRDQKKPMIILISSIKEMEKFGILLEGKDQNIVRKLWPGPVSIIFPCVRKEFTYLHRGKKSLAFRVPANPLLRDFLRKTGPLVAPSANKAGEPPAQTISEAREYFGDTVDFYVSHGKKKIMPSSIFSLANGKLTLIRRGVLPISITL